MQTVLVLDGRNRFHRCAVLARQVVSQGGANGRPVVVPVSTFGTTATTRHTAPFILRRRLRGCGGRPGPRSVVGAMRKTSTRPADLRKLNVPSPSTRSGARARRHWPVDSIAQPLPRPGTGCPLASGRSRRSVQPRNDAWSCSAASVIHRRSKTTRGCSPAAHKDTLLSTRWMSAEASSVFDQGSRGKELHALSVTIVTDQRLSDSYRRRTLQTKSCASDWIRTLRP